MVQKNEHSIRCDYLWTRRELMDCLDHEKNDRNWLHRQRQNRSLSRGILNANERTKNRMEKRKRVRTVLKVVCGLNNGFRQVRIKKTENPSKIWEIVEYCVEKSVDFCPINSYERIIKQKDVRDWTISVINRVEGYKDRYLSPPPAERRERG